MKKFLLFFLLAGIFSVNSNAQGTVLAAGDVAIVQYQSDSPDAFAFVTFVDLVAGTTIYFSDCGATAAGTFLNPCTEGAKKYIIPAGGAVAGDMFFYIAGGGDPLFTTHTDAGITGSLALGTSGDQILVFQDADGAGGTDASLNPTFIFALNGASTGFTGNPASSSTETNLPTGLVDGTSALGVGSGSGPSDEVDNSVFNGTGMPFASIAAAKAAIINAANWYDASDDSEATYAGHVADLVAQMNVLPVELISFDVKAIDRAIEVNWSTASEENNKGFEIQHSLDTRDWNTLGFVDGFGTTAQIQQYTFNHERPTPGLNYYRLKQVDYDGAFEFTTVRVADWSVDGVGSNLLLAVAPNPAKSWLTVSLPSALSVSKQLDIKIYNQMGQIVRREVSQVDSGQLNFNLDDLSEGFYFMEVQDRGLSYSAKFIKQ